MSHITRDLKVFEVFTCQHNNSWYQLWKVPRKVLYIHVINYGKYSKDTLHSGQSIYLPTYNSCYQLWKVHTKILNIQGKVFNWQHNNSCYQLWKVPRKILYIQGNLLPRDLLPTNVTQQLMLPTQESAQKDFTFRAKYFLPANITNHITNFGTYSGRWVWKCFFNYRWSTGFRAKYLPSNITIHVTNFGKYSERWGMLFYKWNIGIRKTSTQSAFQGEVTSHIETLRKTEI